ncbi:MAG TPA: Gfo/Idh/MocA family oxidoreductase [Kofleriaceae bacterium]|jgi:predicted dehydrogenase
MSDLKFALIGCGRVSHKHAEAIANVPGARLVGVCDVDIARANAIAQPLGIPAFADMDEMISSVPEIDIVEILTPSGHHAQHVIRMARHKKHIVVEKPMALRLDDADEMITACDRAGVRLFVVKQNRCNPPVRRLREAIDADRFGKLVMGTARVRWCRRQDYYDLDAWRGTSALDGGVLANQASHYVDLLVWLFGPVESVVAMTATRLVKIETEDTAAVLLRFANGALGIVEATTATRPTDLEGSLSVLGERGAVVIGGFAVNQLQTWNFETSMPSDDDVVVDSTASGGGVYGAGHRVLLDNVVRTIRGQASPLVDGRDGRRSLEVIDAIYRSVESGREVKLAYHSRKSASTANG